MPARAANQFLPPALAAVLISFAVQVSAAAVAGPAALAGTPGSDFATNLPQFVLEVGQPIVREPRTPCVLRMSSPGSPTFPTNGWPGSVKIHGGVSQGYPKKSYGLTLATPARLLDLRESTHWVLNAAFIDRSLMRHKLAYDLFRSLAAPGAARPAVASRFVELTLDGRPQGVYLLMERVDRQLLGLRKFASNEVRHAVIYKAVDHAANFRRAGHGGYEQREPDPLVREYWGPLEDLNRFISGTRDAEFFDSTRGIETRLDLDNAIDFHLLVLVTCNLDGITKNFILARDAPGDAPMAPRFFFAPWDYDGTFGRNWDGSPVAPTAWLSNHLFDRLWTDRAYRERLARRWLELRSAQFSPQSMRGLIDFNVRALGEAASRNAARWRGAAGYYPDSVTFEEDVARMKSWVEERVKWLDQEFTRRAAR